MGNSAKGDADMPHIRIFGDMVVIHAEGMSRRQMRRLAIECFVQTYKAVKKGRAIKKVPQ